MATNNMERMIALASSTFDAHNDPRQLDVDEEVIKALQRLHPATLAEHSTPDGPVIWVLLVPTTSQIMQLFLNDTIGEKELLEQTGPGMQYDCLYLCSALTLPEFRGKGLTKKLALEAISSIRESHPIQTLFVWGFSTEGTGLAKSIARELGLPLLEKTTG